MNKINLPQAAKLTSPNPVSVVCTMKPDGSTNLATVSWWTYLSFNPNMIAYTMTKSYMMVAFALMCSFTLSSVSSY